MTSQKCRSQNGTLLPVAADGKRAGIDQLLKVFDL